MIDLSQLLNVPELPVYLKQTEAHMLAATKSDNQQIRRAAARLVKAGGKRLRPSLVFACASITGRPVKDEAAKLAAAIELVHIGSLVHDDIIDEADTRWSIPTVNINEGASQAIVIGDYLLAAGCSLAASVGQQEANLVATTITKLCEGQYCELAELFNINRTEATYFKAIKGKTAALISLSCILGGMSAGLSDHKIANLKQYGASFGLAFQLIDDLMDLVSSDKLYGKPVGNDIVEGVYTLPVISGLAGQESSKIKAILESKKFTPLLTRLLLSTDSIDQVLLNISKYNQQAAAAIKTFDGQVASALHNLPDKYLNWAINNLVDKSYRAEMLRMSKP